MLERMHKRIAGAAALEAAKGVRFQSFLATMPSPRGISP